jgi:hypothetical protein
MTTTIQQSKHDNKYTIDSTESTKQPQKKQQRRKRQHQNNDKNKIEKRANIDITNKQQRPNKKTKANQTRNISNKPTPKQQSTRKSFNKTLEKTTE